MFSVVKNGFFIIISIILFAIVISLIVREFKQKQIMNKSEELVVNGGISEVEEIKIGGINQSLLIEGADKSNPVCIFLHGGPGAPFPFGVSARSLFPEITKSCTAVYYDQRGSGKSYVKNMDVSIMNMDQFVSDANEVVDFVRNKFNQEQIVVIGNSFGSIVGIELAHRYPEKIRAYIGLGQVTNVVEGQKHAYHWLQTEASKKDDKKTLKILEEIGGAPYFNEREAKLGDLLNKYPGYNYFDENTKKASILGLIKGVFTSPDYSISDIYKTLISAPKFSIFDSKDLQEEIIKTNLFETVPEMKTSVYFIQGKHDKVANYSLAKEYLDTLKTSGKKEFFTLENSAHYPNENDFKEFKKILVRILEEGN
ncbi:alpha/beta hydrolase [Bacillus sp. CGMCC 1.16607]|uniref:alpha/beta hydrolase n=1 Tax=Bacillus sp. CGMCC 1.16607 TaxID=3351842 RepID=UPI00363DB32E